MNKDKLRTCSVCHKLYEYCIKCPEDFNKPTWYFSFCSSNCKDIYSATSSFENGNISQSEAESKLKMLDLSQKKNFGESYQKTLSKIFSAKKASKEKSDENLTHVVTKQVDKNGSESKENKNVKA